MYLLYSLFTFSFAISWQFAPFTLFTQVPFPSVFEISKWQSVAIFILYGLESIDHSTCQKLLGGQIVAVLAVWIPPSLFPHPAIN